MVSSWITHVKKVASQKKISYKEALKVAGASYKKDDKSSPKKEKKEKSKKMEEPKKKGSKMEKMASAKLAKDKPKKTKQGGGKYNE